MGNGSENKPSQLTGGAARGGWLWRWIVGFGVLAVILIVLIVALTTSDGGDGAITGTITGAILATVADGVEPVDASS